MSWRNAEKIEFLGGRRNNSGLPQAKETHTLNKINDICDFSRGGLNTRLYMLVSKPCSETTNIGDRLSLRAVYWLQEQNQTPLLHSPHLTQKNSKRFFVQFSSLLTQEILLKENIFAESVIKY